MAQLNTNSKRLLLNIIIFIIIELLLYYMFIYTELLLKLNIIIYKINIKEIGINYVRAY